MGVYVGHNGQVGVLSVGDEIEVIQRRGEGTSRCLQFALPAVVVSSMVVAYCALRRLA